MSIDDGIAPGPTARNLVTVVVPAYNSEATLHETLSSARAQTHANIEIIVVDDGSLDATAAIVRQHADEDSRVRLVQQENGGVARARNRGISEARGDLIAPLDADDLWAPEKLQRQLEVLHERGDKVALVYTLFAAIDERADIIYQQTGNGYEGNVVAHLCSGNFIGNASSALIRRSAILEAGGYEPGLRDERAQGCEDLLLYFRIAERHEFGAVPECLTGYRESATSMSCDAEQMYRSFGIVEHEIASRHPNFAPQLRSSRINLAKWLYHRARLANNHSGATRMLRQIAVLAPLSLLEMCFVLSMQKMRRALHILGGTSKTRSPRARFQIGSPATNQFRAAGSVGGRQREP